MADEEVRTEEIDFLIQDGLSIVPIEVKSLTNTAGKSLSVYMAKYCPGTSIIFSGKELSVSESKDGGMRVLNIPLPLVDWLPNILRLSSKE